MNEDIKIISNSYNIVNPNIFGFPVSFDAIPKKHRAAIAQKTLGELVAKNPEQDKTVSVDTVAITVRIDTLFDAARYGFKRVSIYSGGKLKRNTSKRWQANFEHSPGVVVKMTYTRKFGNWLTVEASLPKILYGSNLRVLSYSERIKAVKTLSAVGSERLGFSIDLLNDGIGKRLDLFQYIRLGSEENLRSAVASLKQLKVNDRPLDTKNDFSDSAAWFNKTHRLEIYNKTAERLANGEIIPAGILKIESQFKDSYFWSGYSIAELLKDDIIRQLYFSRLWK